MVDFLALSGFWCVSDELSLLMEGFVMRTEADRFVFKNIFLLIVFRRDDDSNLVTLLLLKLFSLESLGSAIFVGIFPVKTLSYLHDSFI